MQSIRAPGANVRDVILGVLHFLLWMFALVALLILFPEIPLWLPGLLYG